MQRSDLISIGCVAVGINRLYARHLAGPGFPILAYHEVTARTLYRHLKALAPYYRIMSLPEALADQVPRRSRPPLVLTFDDGYRSWQTEVLPVLKRLRFPAHFFVCVDFIAGTRLPWYEVVARFAQTRRGHSIRVLDEAFSTRDLVYNSRRCRHFNARIKRLPQAKLDGLVHRLEAELTELDRAHIRDRYLNWEELRSLQSCDFEVGSHGLSHGILSRLPLAQAQEEIAESKRRLESELGREVRYFAYPNGLEQDFNEVVVAEVRRAGYEGALTAQSGWNAPGVDRFCLRRGVAVPGGSVSRLRVTASGLLGRLEEVQRTLRGLRKGEDLGWQGG